MLEITLFFGAKNAGPSGWRVPRPRGTAAPDLGKFSGFQGVPPQVVIIPHG